MATTLTHSGQNFNGFSFSMYNFYRKCKALVWNSTRALLPFRSNNVPHEFFKINTITHRSSRSAEPNARQNLNARSIIFVVHSIKIINLDGWLWSYSFIFSIIQSLLRVYVFVVVLLRSRGTHISYGRTVPHFQTTPGDVIELYFSLSSSWLCSFCWLRCTVMFLLIQCSCMATGEILNGRIKSL